MKKSTPVSAKLPRQLVRMILTAYLGFALALTLIQVVLEYRAEEAHLVEGINDFVDTLQASLSEALWNYDDHQLTAVITGFYKKTLVVGVVVENLDHERWTLGHWVNDGALVSSFDLKRYPIEPKQPPEQNTLDRLKQLSYTVVYHNNQATEHIGNLSLFYSTRSVLERTWQTFMIIILGAVVKTIALWVIAVWLINRMVAKPIETIQRDIQNFDIKRYEKNNVLMPPEEFDRGNELYQLYQTLHQFCGELAENHATIEQYQKNLEGIVEERTAELNATLEELSYANKVKGDFIATVSHEVRTPLNAVLGTAKLLSRTPLNERQQYLLGVIQSGGTSLLALINDILDFSKIDADKLELHYVDFELVRVVQGSVDLFRIIAEEKALSFIFTPPDQPKRVFVRGDATRISQVLNNLISNAIKFTEQGKIEVVLQCEPKLNGRQVIRIKVADTGIGMSAQEQKKLFKAFSQADASTSRKYGGTGLGLAISKRLVEAMKGRISVESTPAKGSCFTFELELDKADSIVTSMPSEPVALNQQSITALIVDDVKINREIVKEILEDNGFNVLCARSGAEALQLMEQTHPQLNVVFMDCLMPEMDGYSATRKIREFETKHSLPAVAVIALTASTFLDVKDKCYAAGMNGFVSKPFSEEELLEAMNTFCNLS